MSFGNLSNSFQAYDNDFGLGHNGARISLNYFDGIPEQNLLSSLVSNNLRLIFKSLLKRDDTTKEKALNDLNGLIDDDLSKQLGKESQFNDDIFLICWSQIFAKLITNESKSIRISSNSFTIKLISLLNKSISKFLKDFIPFLLLGTCDTDSMVSKTCKTEFEKCFNNDQMKLNALWKVFQEQIICLIKEILVNESVDTISDQRYIDAEEARFKYNRLSTSAINLLILTINANDETYVKADFKDIYKDILSSGSFWKSFNLLTTFNLKKYQSILNLIYILYSTKFFKYNKDIFKTAIRNMFKSLTQINKKNIANLNTLIPMILDTLVKLTEYKDGRIWSYDKDSNKKLQEFLSVTSKNVTPHYYDNLFQLYNATKPLNLLEVEKEWLPIWENSLGALNNKPFIGRYGAQLFSEFWKNFHKFLEQNPEINEEHLQGCIMKTLKNGNSMDALPDLKNVFQDIVRADHLEELFENTISQLDAESAQLPKHYIYNILTILLVCPSNEDSLKKLSTFALEKLSNDPSPVVQQELFTLCKKLIDSKSNAIGEELSNVIYELPTWVEKSNYKSAMDILIKYSNSEFIETSDNWQSSIQDFFTVCLSLDIKSSEIITLMASINRNCYEQLVLSDDTVKNYVENYIDSFSFESVDDLKTLFQSHLIDDHLLLRIFTKAEASNKIPEFVQCASLLSNQLKKYLFLDSSFLFKTMFVISDDTTNKVYDMVSTSIGKSTSDDNNSISIKLCSIVINHIRHSQVIITDTNAKELPCLNIAKDIIKLNPETIRHFIPIQIDEFFLEYVPHIDSRISITSTMSINSFLIPLDDEIQDISKWLEVIKVGLFLDYLVSENEHLLSDELIVLFSIIAELADDYNAISDTPDPLICNFTHTLVKSEISKDICLENTLAAISGNDGDTENILSVILSNINDVTTFYKLRVLHRVLENENDQMSKLTLISFIPKIEKYVIDAVRGKDINPSRYLLSAVLLSLLSEIPENETCSKLRTLLAADCIGVRESELLQEKNKTKQSLILLLTMLRVDSASVGINDFVPIAPQRLNMVLKTIEKWLDSDIIYEPSFIGMRLILLNFFYLIMKYPAVVDMNEHLLDIASKLLVDSLSMCQLDDTQYLFSLRKYSLQLCNTVEQFNSSDAFTDEFADDINDNIQELCFIEFKSESNNQISMSFYRQLFNFISSNIKSKDLLSYYDRFFKAFLSFEPNTFKSVGQKRVITLVLGKIIKERQQNQVIEFELKQQQLHPHSHEDEDIFFDAREDLDNNSDDSSDDDNDFKIPLELINKLNDNFPVEYLEYCEKTEFITYLWNWHLTLQFFENISYKMRQLYIEQLKEHDLINKMFDFISDQIDLNEINFFEEQLAGYNIGHYAKMENEFMTHNEDLSNESKYLMAHLMYELFNNVGSLTSAWFLNIRDRSLQNKIDKFVSQFISPLLISSEIDAVSKKVEELEKKDDALSIKINQVTNEIKASYLIDEQNLVISFKLPSNYPLNNVDVIGVSRVGITEQKWKQWIMSTQHVITGMNGSVLDSLELFTKNVHLQFSGFEECAICYSILHAVDRKLPTKICPTCNNRFHGACLYKWFRSSGNNTCPLCRGEIPFRK
ncbi:similar to Saccharomyces cerevisiae YMR247C RKR1 RING domain E3 ubiquitin ligase [Maudiozyma saulgeensis]|uniref:E3 ubiquitin-protein ligase listerin n=1 Tax=Maudiozyma saulgeensis TaxID=1789683 RepID=A0A1X7R9C7_9SACH|nr:similar to Saccharomyces cerevisiae YMR247C RKR1 RING domain E3 ubiquitin ligase [Kazachstania saulgeensis]